MKIEKVLCYNYLVMGGQVVLGKTIFQICASTAPLDNTLVLSETISDNTTINSSLVRYDSYCSHKPHGTSEPPFFSKKGYLPSITSISKIQSIQPQLNHNFTNDNLTNGKPLAYQSLVNIPPTQLRSLLCPVPEETPVPATRTLSSVTVLPAEPALFYFSVRNI